MQTGTARPGSSAVPSTEQGYGGTVRYKDVLGGIIDEYQRAA
ncbi:MAG TPA: hypothetical protein VL984_06685 [Acidimicrobiales bacterium]|nr:hypothetical protein [Acidimicrobiales bacterium]